MFSPSLTVAAPTLVPCQEEVALTKDVEVLDTQSETLKKYVKSLNVTVKPSTILGLLDKYALKEKEIQEKHDAAKKRIAELSEGRKNEANHVAGVTILLRSQEDCEAELHLSYLVSKVSWNPCYEIYISLPTSEEYMNTEARIS